MVRECEVSCNRRCSLFCYDAIEFIQLKCGFSVLVLFGAPDPVLLYMHHPLVVLAAYPAVHISYAQ